MQVWHKNGNRFDKAAEVNIGNVEGAAILTALRVELWHEHPEIKPEPGDHRSTTLGDIIIDEDGKEYRFEMLKVGGYDYPGFTEVTTIFDQGHTEWLAVQALEDAKSIGFDPIRLEREADEYFAMRELETMFHDIAHAPDFEMPAIPDKGRYEVWHTTDSMAGIAAVRFGEPMPEFPRDYTLIGIVEADGLDRAFVLTNSTEIAWIEKPGVVQAWLEDMTAGTRSTSIGDVIVSPDGVPYQVGTTGFTEIESGVADPTHPKGWEYAETDLYESDLPAAAEEIRIDAEAPRLRDTGEDYETYLKIASMRPSNDNEKGIDR